MSPAKCLKPSRPIVFHDENGLVLASDSDKAEVIKSYFKNVTENVKM